MGLTVCETARLRISHFSEYGDEAFILRLLNEPSFIRHIADKNVRTLSDARAYLGSGPIASYAKHGFGLSRVALKEVSVVSAWPAYPDTELTLRTAQAAQGSCRLRRRLIMAELGAWA